MDVSEREGHGDFDVPWHQPSGSRGGHVLAGLCELQQRPFPPLLRAADRYMAAKVARLHADARRPVPPSLQGGVAEVRHQLRWHRRDDGPRS